MSMRGMPTIHSSASGAERAPGVEQDVDALVRAQEAEAAGRPACRPPRARRAAGARPGTRVRCSNAPCSMAWTFAGSIPSAPTSRARPCSECTTTASDALVEAALRAELAGARLARQDVVRGEDDGPRARQQVHVERLERQPLEVHDVGGARRAAVAQHVRDVRRELRGEAPARARRRRRRGGRSARRARSRRARARRRRRSGSSAAGRAAPARASAAHSAWS